MLFILLRLGALEVLAAPIGYASPERRTVVVALSGLYFTAITWWVGQRILAAWNKREQDKDPRHWY